MSTTTEARLESRPPAKPTAATPPPRRRGLGIGARNALVGWSFILPNFLGFAAFTLVPVVIALALAFMRWDSFSAPEFAGLDNFARLLRDDSFWVALRNTALYALGHIPLTMALSLAIAILLNQKLRGVGFFRVAVFFPYITSMVAVAVVWNMLFNPNGGPINQVLHAIGIADAPGWTTSTTWALPAVIITSVWRDMGYFTILYLAGLQSIPTELYEAAEVDGASRWQRFLHVTLPCLRPTSFFVLVMLTVGSFKVFDLIVVMTNGGPGRSTTVLSQLIYREGILEGNYGYSSAISFVLFVIVLTVTVLQFKVQQRRDR